MPLLIVVEEVPFQLVPAPHGFISPERYDQLNQPYNVINQSLTFLSINDDRKVEQRTVIYFMVGLCIPIESGWYFLSQLEVHLSILMLVVNAVHRQRKP